MTTTEKSTIARIKTIAYRISQALKILRTKLKDYIPLLVWLLYEQTRS